MELPDNRFGDVVSDLREDGESWSEIMDKLDRVYDVVDRRVVDERTVDIPAVEITVRDIDGHTRTDSWTYQNGEDLEDVIERARNAPAIAEVIEYEDNHTVSVFQ